MSFGKRGHVHPSSEPTMADQPRGLNFGPSVVVGLYLFCGVAAIWGLAHGLRQKNVKSAPLLAAAALVEPISPTRKAVTKEFDAALPLYPTYDIRRICTARYPRDYSGRNTCVRVEEEAKWGANAYPADEDVRTLCAVRNRTDWSQYFTCLKLEMAAKYPPNERPDRPSFRITEKCLTEWPSNFRMQKYCIDQQESAREKALGLRGRAGDVVASNCATEWPLDWNMYHYCMEQQLRARRKL